MKTLNDDQANAVSGGIWTTYELDEKTGYIIQCGCLGPRTITPESPGYDELIKCLCPSNCHCS